MFHEFLQYLHTPECKTGVFDTIISFVISGAIASVLLPLTIWLWRRNRDVRMRIMLQFFLLQVFHRIVDVYLRLASITDPHHRLMEALKAGKIPMVNSHTVYGNLENKLWLFHEIVEGKELEKEVPKRTAAELDELAANCRDTIDEIDVLAGLAASSPKTLEVLISLRFCAFAMRDELVRIKKNGATFTQLYDVAPLELKGLNMAFMRERKLIDRKMRWQWRRWLLSLCASALVQYLLFALRGFRRKREPEPLS